VQPALGRERFFPALMPLSETEASDDPVEPAPGTEPCETEARKPGLLATLGALLFGIGITQAMLGRRDE
jgi:hypothetical protein